MLPRDFNKTILKFERVKLKALNDIYISNVVSVDDSYVMEEDIFVTIIITEEGRTSANFCSKSILSLYQTFTIDLGLVITHVFTYNYSGRQPEDYLD